MVRVSQISYPLSVVQGSLDSALDVASTITGEAVSDEKQEQLNASVLQYYQNEWLLELCAQWKGDYDIETHPELLEY